MGIEKVAREVTDACAECVLKDFFTQGHSSLSQQSFLYLSTSSVLSVPRASVSPISENAEHSASGHGTIAADCHVDTASPCDL